MNQPLSGAEWTVMLVLAGFIIVLNLSLLFAFLHRSRDQQKSRSPHIPRRAPWESELAEPTAELSRQVAGLRGQDEAKKDTPKPPSSS